MTRRIEDFKVLMNNYGNIQQYTEASANSEGSAMKKFDAYGQGIEARIKKIQASFEKLSMIVANSGTVKGVLLLADGLLKLLTVGDGLITTTLLWSAAVVGLYKGLSLIKGLNLVGRVKMITLQVCPPQTDGDIERVNYRNGIINKSLCRKQLKWCA